MIVAESVKDFLTVDEVAALLDLRPVTIYRWCRAGRLAAIKLGKEWRIPRAALAELLRPGTAHRAAYRAYEDEPMDELSPAARALARRLLLHEAGGRAEPAALAEAAGRAHGRLHGRLAGVIGATGFATLFARAVQLALPEHPGLRHLRVEAGPAGGLAGLAEFAAASAPEPAAAAAGLTAMFVNFIGLLGTFIGEDLALRLVRQAWPDVADDAFDAADAEGGA
jgi:excisionase family DNA binding protein